MSRYATVPKLSALQNSIYHLSSLVQSASTVLGATMSPQIHPSGFRISDRPVAASFAHPYSFQPLPDYSLRDDACVMGTTNLGGVEEAWVRYWDEASTVAQLEFKVEEPVQTKAVTPAKEEKKKKKAKGSNVLYVCRCSSDEYARRR